MPRKGPVSKRDVLPDPIYNSKLVTRLINKMMVDGKRGTSQKILYGAFELVKERSGKDPLEVFEAALNNVMPVLEVRARRVGGANYQVPVEVRPDRRSTLGLRYLVNYSRLRGEKTMEERLANEILDASNNTGSSVKKRNGLPMAGASHDDFRVLDRLLRRTDLNTNGARLALGGYGALTHNENTYREHERTHRPPPARAYAPIPRFINCGEEWNALCAWRVVGRICERVEEGSQWRVSGASRDNAGRCEHRYRGRRRCCQGTACSCHLPSGRFAVAKSIRARGCSHQGSRCHRSRSGTRTRRVSPLPGTFAQFDYCLLPARIGAGTRRFHGSPV